MLKHAWSFLFFLLVTTGCKEIGTPTPTSEQYKVMSAYRELGPSLIPGLVTGNPTQRRIENYRFHYDATTKKLVKVNFSIDDYLDGKLETDREGSRDFRYDLDGYLMSTTDTTVEKNAFFTSPIKSTLHRQYLYAAGLLTKMGGMYYEYDEKSRIKKYYSVDSNNQISSLYEFKDGVIFRYVTYGTEYDLTTNSSGYITRLEAPNHNLVTTYVYDDKGRQSSVEFQRNKKLVYKNLYIYDDNPVNNLPLMSLDDVLFGNSIKGQQPFTHFGANAQYLVKIIRTEPQNDGSLRTYIYREYEYKYNEVNMTIEFKTIIYDGKTSTPPILLIKFTYAKI